MKNSHHLATSALVIASALFLGACIAETPPSSTDTPEEPSSEAEQALIACNGTNEVYVQYYSDPAMTNVIGYRLCYCNGNEVSGGQWSRYSTAATYACW